MQEDEKNKLQELKNSELEQVNGGDFCKWSPWTDTGSRRYCKHCHKYAPVESRTLFYILGLREDQRCKLCGGEIERTVCDIPNMTTYVRR